MNYFLSLHSKQENMLSKNQIKWVHSLELKKNRKKEGLFVAEGPKVVGDLQRADYVARALFSTTERPNAQLITDDELRKLSFLQHPQEVLAVFEIPKTSQFSIPNCEATTLNSKLLTLNSSLSLALDGVQDPGNLGTIIRIADWFGIETIYCSEDTADCYNPKVVQATMGSLAHVDLVYTDLEALLRQYDGPIYGTLLDGQNIYQQELSNEGIIVMGNEGNGISPAIRQLITHKLLIPNYNPSSETAESLNVAIATAITCAEFRRR
jgi:TrmH family RNA methyltransferase